jgi:hypothetical protein
MNPANSDRMARHAVPGLAWPLAALVVASVLWGGAVTGTKYALGGFAPVTLLSVELAAATAALWAALATGQTWRTRAPAFGMQSDNSGCPVPIGTAGGTAAADQRPGRARPASIGTRGWMLTGRL